MKTDAVRRRLYLAAARRAEKHRRAILALRTRVRRDRFDAGAEALDAAEVALEGEVIDALTGAIATGLAAAACNANHHRLLEKASTLFGTAVRRPFDRDPRAPIPSVRDLEAAVEAVLDELGIAALERRVGS